MNSLEDKNQDNRQNEETMAITILMYKRKNFYQPKENLAALNDKLQKILRVIR